jgi:hypothetical protein
MLQGLQKDPPYSCNEQAVFQCLLDLVTDFSKTHPNFFIFFPGLSLAILGPKQFLHNALNYA